MDGIVTALTTPVRDDFLDRFRRKPRPDYRKKLTDSAPPPAPVAGVDTFFPMFPGVEPLAIGRTAFQSVAVAALQAMDRVHRCEGRAAEAAISLGQRDKLRHLIGEMEATRRMLRGMLSPQGAAMLERNASASVKETPEPSWWFALCEALHVLEEGASGIQSIAAAQSREHAGHTLSDFVASLLQRHYQALFVEAEQWMS